MAKYYKELFGKRDHHRSSVDPLVMEVRPYLTVEQ